ncbi:hypothetical protein CDJ58_03815 [Campylobacter lari]|nr:hypothetical protein [Campylobacter lari]EAK5748526.1 hypothetical protein [Campylobacter lari]EAK9878187.1 hypothetical protein [Campylobacter lari]
MLNFILDLDFRGFLLAFSLIIIVIFFIFFREKCFNINNNIITAINLYWILFLIFCFIAIIFFIFSAEPDEKFINSLKEKNIINQETLNAYLNNDDYPIDTLGFGICERNNYNGKTCNEYLKYVIAKLQKEHQENLKKEQEKLQKEQIKLKEKNENIKKITDEYFLIQK